MMRISFNFIDMEPERPPRPTIGPIGPIGIPVEEPRWSSLAFDMDEAGWATRLVHFDIGSAPQKWYEINREGFDPFTSPFVRSFVRFHRSLAPELMG